MFLNWVLEHFMQILQKDFPNIHGSWPGLTLWSDTIGPNQAHWVKVFWAQGKFPWDLYYIKMPKNVLKLSFRTFYANFIKRLSKYPGGLTRIDPLWSGTIGPNQAHWVKVVWAQGKGPCDLDFLKMLKNVLKLSFRTFYAKFIKRLSKYPGGLTRPDPLGSGTIGPNQPHWVKVV